MWQERGSSSNDENEDIEKVIILDRTPRFDTKNADPFGLKAKLAEYGNKLNKVELEKARNKGKIVIGNHNFSFLVLFILFRYYRYLTIIYL